MVLVVVVVVVVVVGQAATQEAPGYLGKNPKTLNPQTHKTPKPTQKNRKPTNKNPKALKQQQHPV